MKIFIATPLADIKVGGRLSIYDEGGFWQHGEVVSIRGDIIGFCDDRRGYIPIEIQCRAA